LVSASGRSRVRGFGHGRRTGIVVGARFWAL